MIAVVSDSSAPRVDGISVIVDEGLMLNEGASRVLLAGSTDRGRRPATHHKHYRARRLFPAARLGPGGYPLVLTPLAAYRELDRLRPTTVEVHTLGILGLTAICWAKRNDCRAEFVYHTDLEQYAEHYPVATRSLLVVLWMLRLVPTSLRELLRADCRPVLADFMDQFQLIHVFSAKAEHLLTGRLGVTAAIVRAGLRLPPIDTEVAPARARGDCFRFGYVGRISREKGLEALFSAVELLSRTGVDFQCTFTGPVADRRIGSRLRRLARKLPHMVCYEGAVSREQAQDRMRSLDVLVMPSSTDTLSLTLREALHSGTTVMAVDEELWPDERPRNLRFVESSPAAIMRALHDMASRDGGAPE